MTDNILQTLQHLVQDVIAPDVRELKVRQASFGNLVDERFRAQAKQSEMQFNALMAAIAESKAQADLARVREISDLRERIAVIESKLATKAS
ncbi:MAG TPA: hypothetical protein VE178_05795 [Silvibacterium sp.]|nr:hypothetical protein [Silvibacterium sp.]